MDANDLRIGNLLNESGDIVAVGFGTFKNWKLYNLSEHLEPIPLTEEWLLKLGFEKRSDFFMHVQNDEHKSTTCLNIDYENNSFKFACQHFWYAVQYVHQLQNLYHSLTGEELTLKQSE